MSRDRAHALPRQRARESPSACPSATVASMVGLLRAKARSVANAFPPCQRGAAEESAPTESRRGWPDWAGPAADCHHKGQAPDAPGRTHIPCRAAPRRKSLESDAGPGGSIASAVRKRSSWVCGFILASGIVGAGQVAHPQDEIANPRAALVRLGGEHAKLRSRQAEAAHAGIEMDRGIERRAHFDAPPPTSRRSRRAN